MKALVLLGQLSLPSLSGVGKWVPALERKAKAGKVRAGVHGAGRTVSSIKSTCAIPSTCVTRFTSWVDIRQVMKALRLLLLLWRASQPASHVFREFVTDNWPQFLDIGTQFTDLVTAVLECVDAVCGRVVSSRSRWVWCCLTRWSCWNMHNHSPLLLDNYSPPLAPTTHRYY